MPVCSISDHRYLSPIGFVRGDIREAEQEGFTVSLCGAGSHSEPVFAALPAQKALTTPN
ncbi:hypothetical protein AGR2A_Cc100127 [Agrobacterium genomosp. 2 str. CFBP 5494]|uniref:Uncharacterized protein n=1 Tax=Agrobacterium genomosp. 2 str. CFBP 5494 TaxID=1183436 RepID=A0A9W5AXJ4_9HYPH|nr:hypothetical protein AGR2A_Cc100127 [Agrobacterium genomosp. 2 str. CFBP 5494]